MKKLLALLLATVMLLGLLAGCGKTEDKSTEDTKADTAAVKLALVVAGKFGDRSFYDSSKEGADRLAADLGVQVTTIECNN